MAPHCHKFKFPSRCIREKQRKLNHTWLVNNKWLRYSISKDSVSCVYCVLFGKPERALHQVGAFSSTKGISDWANIGRLVKLHISQSSPHHDAVIKGDNYLHIASGKQKDICSHLSSQFTETIERNRHILRAIIDVIVLCGQQLASFFLCFNFVSRLILILHVTYTTMTTEQSTLHQ